MIALTLGEIAAAVSGTLIPGSSGADASTVVSGLPQTDSRELQPGGIFFAKRGEETDGHRFAGAAVDAGAALIIGERETDDRVPQIIVSDTVEALGSLAREVVARVRAGGRLQVVAVTGSNGKTTTKNLLHAILSGEGETVAPEKSFNNEVGAPLTMLKVTPDTRYLVLEMGASVRGDIARLVRMVRPDVGIVLKVGLAHAGEFGGIEFTVQAKSEMVTDLLPGDTAVLNRDDPRVAGMAERTAAQLLWFGRSPEAQVRAEDVAVHPWGTSFTLHLPGHEPMPVAFRVLGEHHVMNALAATAAATVFGVAPERIVAALQSVTRAERWRMEVLPGRDGITVINDAYNASPDSMAAALRTLVQIVPESGRSIAVLGEMTELGDLHGEEHDRIGVLAVRLNIDKLVVVGAGARRLYLAAVAQGSWDEECVFAEDADEAFRIVTEMLQPGDTVLVKSSNAAGLRFLGDRLAEHVA